MKGGGEGGRERGEEESVYSEVEDVVDVVATPPPQYSDTHCDTCEQEEEEERKNEKEQTRRKEEEEETEERKRKEKEEVLSPLPDALPSPPPLMLYHSEKTPDPIAAIPRYPDTIPKKSPLPPLDAILQ